MYETSRLPERLTSLRNLRGPVARALLRRGVHMRPKRNKCKSKTFKKQKNMALGIMPDKTKQALYTAFMFVFGKSMQS
ncbi:hypothetical protein BBA71_04815 [Acetobacter pasteurianus]|nr:hypothetical protein BBA71_04815 [Acetobacter pasteurianus]